MKITEIKNSRQLHEAYTSDVPTRVADFTEKTGIVKRKACTKLLVIERDNQIFTTQKWFITWTNNELIYDIKNNNWVNLDMFDRGESYCKSILLFEEENDE